MKLVIVDYGSGNLRSVAKAFERVSSACEEAVSVEVTSSAAGVTEADRVVLPGVGAYGDCRRGIAAIDGLGEALEAFVKTHARPFLGICVGMQLMASRGVEHGVHQGFGWIPGEVSILQPSDSRLKIPHMGWNELSIAKSHPVLAGAPNDVTHAYFVHSYAMAVEDEGDLIATTDYGGPVTAAVERENIFGAQFHPEKSARVGLAILENFASA